MANYNDSPDFTQDWSDHFDDYDSAFWEDHYAVDFHFGFEHEAYYYDTSEYESDYYEPGSSNECEEDYMEEAYEELDIMKTDKRKQEILNWLFGTCSIVKKVNESVFYVQRGLFMRLWDNTIIDTIDWLRAEGFENGNVVGNWYVTLSGQEGDCEQKVFFYLVSDTIGVPFIAPQGPQETLFNNHITDTACSNNITTDDIPF